MRLVSWVVWLAACSSPPIERLGLDEPALPQEVEESPPPPDPWGPPPEVPAYPQPCSHPGRGGAVVIADNVQVFHEEMPLRWRAADDHLYELGDDPLVPKDLGPTSAFPGKVWDDCYWYRGRSYERGIPYDDSGPRLAIERIDRATGETKRLGAGVWGLEVILPYRDHVYLGIFGHYVGGVVRVSKDGGEQEDVLLPVDRNQREADYVVRLAPHRDGILMTATRRVAWLSVDGSPASIVYAADDRIGGAVLDGDSVFIADAGDPYWEAKANGKIVRVGVHDGSSRQLAGPLAGPAAIVTHGHDVYFMLEDSGDIWSVPKTGGASHSSTLQSLRDSFTNRNRSPLIGSCLSPLSTRPYR